MRHNKHPCAALLALLLLAVFMAGCPSVQLAPDGPYKGDTILYTADQTIVGAYDTLHGFVSWEYENRATLAQWPEIRAAADQVRANARQWIGSAVALRDAYAAVPSEASRAALERSLRVLAAALLEATRYMAADHPQPQPPPPSS